VVGEFHEALDRAAFDAYGLPVGASDDSIFLAHLLAVNTERAAPGNAMAQKFLFALEVFKGLLTPLIAVVTAYIAWQQWRTNERKAKLDRYDRRLRIYQRVIEFIGIATRDFKPEPRDVITFNADTAEADFLFGSEIHAYIRELAQRAMKSRAAHLEYRDYTQQPPPGYDHKKVTDEMHKQSEWLAEQYEAAPQKFRKYLDVSR
jgi:hypothetical protein